ncbi:hypothetical protein [Floccifex sp.]
MRLFSLSCFKILFEQEEYEIIVNNHIEVYQYEVYRKELGTLKYIDMMPITLEEFRKFYFYDEQATNRKIIDERIIAKIASSLNFIENIKIQVSPISCFRIILNTNEYYIFLHKTDKKSFKYEIYQKKINTLKYTNTIFVPLKMIRNYYFGDENETNYQIIDEIVMPQLNIK